MEERPSDWPPPPPAGPDRFTRGLYVTLACLALVLVMLGATLLVPQKGQSGMAIVQGSAPKVSPNVAAAPGIPADQIEQRLLAAAASTGGEVEVSLVWNSLSDLDIEVVDPSGEKTWAEHPHASSGGVQDVDANPTLLTLTGHEMARSGRPPGAGEMLPVPDFLIDPGERFAGSDPVAQQLAKLMEQQLGGGGMLGLSSEGKARSRFSRKPIEHIYFARAPRGTYTVYAHCYSWREPNRNPLPYTVQVKSKGKLYYQTAGTLGPANWIENGTPPMQVCQFVMR